MVVVALHASETGYHKSTVGPIYSCGCLYSLIIETLRLG